MQRIRKSRVHVTLFAAAAAIETWNNILYGYMPNVSEAQLYSQCAGSNPAPSTSIQDALTSMKNSGVVNEGCLPYTNNTACNDGGWETSYFSFQVQTPPLSDCGTPWCNCTSGGTLPSERFHVADYEELPISQFANADQLKHALLNYGPIPLWFYDNGVHPGYNHAYLLYGWNLEGKAMLKDSWPDASTVENTTRTLEQIRQLFVSNPTLYKAYILKKTAQRPAVYRQVRSGSSWIDPNPVLQTICIPARIPTLFTITSNRSYICNPPATYTISGPFSIYDNETVTWSYEIMSGSPTISFGSPNSTSTTVSAGGGDGYVNIVASIKRPNGICESYKKLNVRVSLGIPVTLTKNYDYCVGTSYQAIEYVASSTISGLNYTWTFYPTSGTNYYTYTTNYPTSSQFLMHLYTLPTGYGLVLSVTDPNYPGATNGFTNGNYVQSCGGYGGYGYMMMSSDLWVTNTEDVLVFPVPATKEINVITRNDELYDLKVIDLYGYTLMSVTGRRSFTLDLSQARRGIYQIQLVPRGKSRKPITKRIVLE